MLSSVQILKSLSTLRHLSSVRQVHLCTGLTLHFIFIPKSPYGLANGLGLISGIVEIKKYK
jgi:hypothetical protein